jgi:hypothetical protein
MAKESGVGWTLCKVDNSAGALMDLMNDVTNLDLSMFNGVQDVTGIDKVAIERLLLLADYSLDLTCVFNDAGSDSEFSVFKNTNVAATAARESELTISAQKMNAIIMFPTVSRARAADGSFITSANGQLSNGTLPAWTT